eukprot:1512669-Rhodomonas_salina.2
MHRATPLLLCLCGLVSDVNSFSVSPALWNNAVLKGGETAGAVNRAVGFGSVGSHSRSVLRSRTGTCQVAMAEVETSKAEVLANELREVEFPLSSGSLCDVWY